jgi:hypothetical protein
VEGGKINKKSNSRYFSVVKMVKPNASRDNATS